MNPGEDLDNAYQLARTAIAHYRLRDARRHLDEAREKLDGLAPEERFEPDIRIRLTESWLTLDDIGLGAALEQVAQGRHDAEAAGRDDLRGLAHIQASVLNARAGHIEEALGELRTAVDLSPAFSVEDRVRLLINKGAIGSQAGALGEAAEDLRTAASMAADSPQYKFMATHNLGFVEYLRGDLPAALRWMAAADELEADVDRCVSRLDRARVLMEVGLVDDAVVLLEQAAVGMREAHLWEELSDALLEMGRCALLRGRTVDAVRAADQMVDTAAGRGDHSRDLEARSIRLESLAARPGVPTRDLVDEATTLLADAREADQAWLVDRCTAWGVILSGRAGIPIDETAVGGHLRRMRASPYLATRALAILAQLSLPATPARRGQLVRAAALDVANARAGMSNLDLRSAVAIHISPVIEVDLAQAVLSHDAWSALAATERWRSALDSVPSVLPPADREVASLWSSLRQRHEDLRNSPPGQSGPLRSEVARIERHLRELSWTGTTVTTMRSRRRPRRGEMGSATVLNYFLAGDVAWVVVLLPGQKAELLNMGSRQEVGALVTRATADANAAARVGHGLLAASVLGSLHQSLGLLDDTLLPSHLGDGPIIIVPGGELAHLPWGMLPRLRDRPVTVSRSLGAWHAGATKLPHPARVAVATGPDLELAQSEADAVLGMW